MIGFLVFTLLAVVVIWLLIITPGAWVPRGIALAALLAGATLTLWPHHPNGAPTTASPPERAKFAGCVVDERAGVIYLWLVTDVPRGYTQPYTRDLHEVCEASKKAAGQGVRVGFAREKGAARGKVTGQQIPKYHFRPYVLPEAKAPQKEPSAP